MFCDGLALGVQEKYLLSYEWERQARAASRSALHRDVFCTVQVQVRG